MWMKEWYIRFGGVDGWLWGLWYLGIIFFSGRVHYGIGNKTGFFQPFGRLFLPGTLKNVPCSLNELLVSFQEEPISSGIGRFCRLELTDDNWSSFDKKIETRKIVPNRQPVVRKSPSFDQKNRNWASWLSVGTSSLQNRPIPLDSSRKLTNCSLRAGDIF